jgi:CheY-like chemotaxis protein
MTGIDLILKELQDSEARVRRGGRRKSTIGVSPKAASSPKATTTPTIIHRNSSNEEEKNSTTLLPFHPQPISSSEEEFSLRLMSTDMLKNIDSMKLYAQNIRNTNAFMLMTINRCLDYAKASQGLKLTPKYETIDLRETLALPLTCMTNIQQKVKITLEPYSTELICSHVVTDKQWLQENILCLLSNAVKYSSGGDVKILVSMQPRPPLNSSGKVLSVTHRDTLNSVDSVPLDESPPSPHRVGGIVGSRSRASSDSIQTISKIVTDFVTGGGSAGGVVVGRDAKVSPFSSFITNNTTSTHHNHHNHNNNNSSWYHAASSSVHETNNNNNNNNTVPPPPSASPSSSPQQSRYHRRINGGSGSDPHHHHNNHSSSHHSSTGGGAGTTNHHNHNHNRLMNDKDLDSYTEMMVFEIMDQGIGMSEEAMQSLFNPFQQTQKLAGGTGLGLYSLSKRIEALKGQYGVKKREDGLQGSVFWFSIPYRPDKIITSLAKRFMTSAPNHTTNNASSASAHHSHPPPLRFSLSSCDSADFQCNMMEVIEEHHHPMIMIGTEETAAIATTTITTPTAASGPARTRSCSSLTYSHSDKTHSNSATDSQAAGTVTGTASKNGSFRSLNILLAEDTHSVAKMTTMMLKKMGHRVTLAENGEIALQKIIQSYEKTIIMAEEETKNSHHQEMELELGLEQQKPQELVFDVVLMDLQMPVMDGLEATRRLREYEQKHYEKTGQEVHQMIIGVTAATDDETIEEGMNVGIDDFMPKPFSMDSLHSKVMSFLNNSSE